MQKEKKNVAIKTKIEKEGSRPQVIRLAFYENGTRSKFYCTLLASKTRTIVKVNKTVKELINCYFYEYFFVFVMFIILKFIA